MHNSTNRMAGARCAVLLRLLLCGPAARAPKQKICNSCSCAGRRCALPDVDLNRGLRA